MNNLKNLASQTTSQGSPEQKPKSSSYWLTPEEIQALHEDAKKAQAYYRKRLAQAKKK